MPKLGLGLGLANQSYISPIYLTLFRRCGLLSYTTPLDDKTSNEYNFIKCDVGGTPNVSGDYIKLESAYAEIVAADTSNIIVDGVGDPKILEIATLTNNTNNQFFADVQGGELVKTAFYDTSLTGDCLVDANKLMGFNEPLVESNGERVIATDGIVYVYKTGISLDIDERNEVTK